MIDDRKIRAKELRVGDQVRVTVMGGSEVITAEAVTEVDGRVRVYWAWAPSLGVASSWHVLDPDQELWVPR